MTPEAIAKLRRTFIAVAMASFLLVIAVLGIAAGISNMVVVADDAERTIDAIIDAGGDIPSEANFQGGTFHEEASFGLRFFAVTFDYNGEVTGVELTHVALVDTAAAREAAEVAADPSTLTGLGRMGSYYYKEGSVEGGSMVVFLDCSTLLANAQSATLRTVFVCIAAVLVTLLLVIVFSKRAIQPEVENARRQQQFMTNAGHELKTPIAVIRANTELTEMMSGETEWTQSTLRQVDRLDGLVRDLMTIVRGEEKAAAEGGLSEVDVSLVVGAAVESFQSMARQNGVDLQIDAVPGVSIRGQASTVEQLTCLLVDNAIKYCDAEGQVRVQLAKARVGRGCTLAVSNNYADGADVDYRRFFERFYREDESHENQQGYGIGLSVAQSICESYHGSIKASWKAGVITFTCVLRDA